MNEQDSKPWDGEGLPPVGAKCEIQTDDLSDFYQVTIQAYSNDGKVVLVYDDFDDNCEYDYWFIDDTIFRPIKTDVEKEREQLIEIIDSYNMSSGVLADLIINAGWRPPKQD